MKSNQERRHSSRSKSAAPRSDQGSAGALTPGTEANPADHAEPTLANAFPIVGIGASAGGLEALTAFFKALPADTGMAFVLVQHMDPKHESLLHRLLAKETPMPVT